MPLMNVRACVETVQERLRRVMALHLDPQWGSRFWIERAAERGLRSAEEIQRLEDLSPLGPMGPGDLEGRPLCDLIPRRFQARLDRFVVAQTGGAPGSGIWTAYRDDEFEEAFVLPFVAAAGHVGFPASTFWLYVGPSGPHMIGKAARHLAKALGSPDPFSVDFDPRWARRLPEGTFGRRRYLQHVLDQAMDVVRSQPVEVLFTTPTVLQPLAQAMSREQRERIRGVLYDGTELSAAALRFCQEQLFPNAVHLAGYGHTLFGCCMEFCTAPGRELRYYPYGNRLVLEVVDETAGTAPRGHPGRVCFTRLDESMLIVRYLEHDRATCVDVPADAPEGLVLPGIANPATADESAMQIGLGRP